jgi:hypothetical protein
MISAIGRSSLGLFVRDKFTLFVLSAWEMAIEFASESVSAPGFPWVNSGAEGLEERAVDVEDESLFDGGLSIGVGESLRQLLEE